MPYIASYLLEGEALRERLRRGPLTPRRAIEIAAAIADALSAARAVGAAPFTRGSRIQTVNAVLEADPPSFRATSPRQSNAS